MATTPAPKQPSRHRLERRVASELAGVGYTRSGATLVVGVSGGPDSTALLLSLARLKDSHGLLLHVAHAKQVDFRGEEADADAAFAKGLADRLGLPFSVDEQDTLAYQKERRISSFEQAAREMRYSFLAKTAKSVGARAVAVGHTEDDLAETVLLHILRGSGLHGLRGMARLSDWPWPHQGRGLSLFRPLLGIPKSETTAYCDYLGEGYQQDSGNQLMRFTRNRVRRDLLPKLAEDYNPKVREALVRLSRTADSELDFVEGEVERVWAEVASINIASTRAYAAGEVDVWLDRQALARFHPFLQSLVLRRAYVEVSGDARRLRESHLTAMLSLVGEGQSGRSLDLPRGAGFHQLHDRLLLSRRASLPCPFPVLEGEFDLPFPDVNGGASQVEAGPWRVTLSYGGSQEFNASDRSGGSEPLSACLDAAALGRVGAVRAWRAGDRFQPSGMEGHKKLQNLFTDAKIPREWRGRVPLLVCERGVAWVVGYRVAEWAKANASTGPALWVEFGPTG